MKNYVFRIVVCISFLYSCNKDRSDDTQMQSDDENTSSFLIMKNADDPLLLQHEENDVKTFYYGQRNNSGTPINIDLIEVVRQNDTTLFTVDDLGQPKHIVTQNGVQIGLNWLSEESAAVVMISPDGEQQINFIVDPYNISSKSSITASKNNRAYRKVVSKTNSSLLAKTLDSYATKNSNGNVNINVSSCFEPTDVQRVDLIVKSDVTGLNIGRFPATKGSNVGEFFATIPTSTATEIEIKDDICIPLAKALNLTCDVATKTLFLDAFCTSLSAAIATSGIGAPAAAPFFIACETAVTELRVFCLFNSGPAGSPTLASTLCNAPGLNRTFTESLKINAVASGGFLNANGGSSSSSSSVIVDGDGPFPNLSIDLGSATSSSSLIVSPAVPSNEQNYSVYVDLFCVYQNTTVEFTVVGTDGFSDTGILVSSTPTLQPLKSERFSFSVPGAATGVRDNVTVTITFPDGKSEVRNASLVFG